MKDTQAFAQILGSRVVAAAACLFILCGQPILGAGLAEDLPPGESPPTSVKQSFTVNYKISEPCSLVFFVDTLSRPQKKAWLKERGLTVNSGRPSPPVFSGALCTCRVKTYAARSHSSSVLTK
jgi:hypothetical protein